MQLISVNLKCCTNTEYSTYYKKITLYTPKKEGRQTKSTWNSTMNLEFLIKYLTGFNIK